MTPWLVDHEPVSSSSFSSIWLLCLVIRPALCPPTPTSGSSFFRMSIWHHTRDIWLLVNNTECMPEIQQTWPVLFWNAKVLWGQQCNSRSFNVSSSVFMAIFVSIVLLLYLRHVTPTNMSQKSPVHVYRCLSNHLWYSRGDEEAVPRISAMRGESAVPGSAGLEVAPAADWMAPNLQERKGVRDMQRFSVETFEEWSSGTNCSLKHWCDPTRRRGIRGLRRIRMWTELID